MENSSSDSKEHISGFAKLNHEELLARGMMSDAFSGGFTAWQAPEPEELETILQGYQVKGFLGRGGMGAVYRVLQPDLERECALKLLPLEVSLAPGFEERFLLEARAMARLDHPNIVTIYDFGRTSEGHLYYVMECVEGMDLSALIKDGGLDIAGALDIVSQVCVALEYAHNEGYVHRDIKPANILVNTKGVIKVTDFGLAKLLNQDVPDYGMTMTGQVMGTPDYMAPEQAHGGKVDQRADIYALGVLLYEMLTGSLPKGIFAPPSQRVQVDVRLDEIVIRALQQEPEKRYQQACEIKTSIDQIRKDSTADKTTYIAPESAVATEPLQKPVSEKPDNPTEPITKIFTKKKSTSLPYLISTVGLLFIGSLFYFFFKYRKPNIAPHGLTISSPEPELPASTKPVPSTKTETSLKPEPGKKYINSLGVPYVPVPGTDVLFSVWETRRREYHKFAYDISPDWEPTGPDFPDTYPALHTSWQSASNYCRWLTKKELEEGNIEPNMEYRLPTDLEWSAAVGLGKEDGKDPKTRSGKIQNVYPWGKEWPVPEIIKNETDDGKLVEVAQFIVGGNLLLQGKLETFDFKKLRQFKDKFVFSLRNYARKNNRDLTETIETLQWLPKFHKLSSFTYNGNTFVLCMTHSWLPDQLNIETANFCDLDFCKKLILLDGGKHKNSIFWSGASWQDGEWKIGQQGIPKDRFLNADDYKQGRGHLLVKFEKGEFYFLKEVKYSSATKGIYFLKGTLSKSELKKVTEQKFTEQLTKWRKAAVIAIDKLLPTYENDWQEKLQPADELWENQFGIKGMAGSAREWVWDKYYQDDQFFGPRTLRGGSLRSRARGPEALDLKHLHRSWISPLDYFCIHTKKLKDELLSSKRFSQQAHIPKGWYGFRPVLAFSSGSYPSSLEEHLEQQQAPENVFTNSLGMSFKAIKNKDLLWCTHEVRNLDYRAFNSASKYGYKQSAQDGYRWAYHPVRNVSWNDAVKYCGWLTAKERKSGKISKQQQYRLPTYTEWKTLRQLEEPSPIYRVNYNDQWVGNFTDATRSITTNTYFHAFGADGFIQTSPVASFPPRSGFYDVAGNVSEWVTDNELEDSESRRYVDTNYLLNGNSTDIKGKIINGSSTKFPHVGFRIVLETILNK